jgi:hypothetical protein
MPGSLVAIADKIVEHKADYLLALLGHRLRRHDRLRGFGWLLDDGFAGQSARLWSALDGRRRLMDHRLYTFVVRLRARPFSRRQQSK